MDEKLIIVTDRDHLEGIKEELIKGNQRIVLEFSAVRFITSMELGTLLSINKIVSAGGGQLVIRNPRPEVREVIEVTKLDLVLCLED